VEQLVARMQAQNSLIAQAYGVVKPVDPLDFSARFVA
jgi:hypothetical protein